MIQFGVTRDVWTFDITGDNDAVVESTGSYLIVDDDEIGEPIATVTVYTLDVDRLRGALEAAAAGEPVDAILLALDAAALASDQHRPPNEDDGSPTP